MKTKKNFWVMIICLLCLFQVEANGLEISANSSYNSKMTVSAEMNLNDYFELIRLSPNPYMLMRNTDLYIEISAGRAPEADEEFLLRFENMDNPVSSNVFSFPNTLFNNNFFNVIINLNVQHLNFTTGTYSISAAFQSSDSMEPPEFVLIGELEILDFVSYFNNIDISQGQYMLYRDRDLRISGSFVTPPDFNETLTFRFEKMGSIGTPTDYPCPTFNYTDFQVFINLIENGFTAGEYYVSAALHSIGAFPWEIFFEPVGIINILDFVPFEAVPESENAYISNPLNDLWAGWNGTFTLSYSAEFETSDIAQIAMTIRPKLVLFRNNENERIKISESFFDELYPEFQNDKGVWGYTSLSSNGDFLAGSYEIKIDFNPDSPSEGDLTWTVLEFEIPEVPEPNSVILVHTGYGLYETSLIGNQDTFDLVIEGWNYGGSSSVSLLPANTIIGSPGWNSYQYRLREYERIDNSDGTLTMTGINMAYVDGANSSVTYPIVPEEYILVFSSTSGYVKTSPITVFDGKTQITPVLTGVEVSTLPYKTLYKSGDKLDLSGMTVRALYDITNGRPITDFTTVPAEGSELTLENTSVSVSYSENGVTNSTSFPINVTTTDNWTVHQLTNNQDRPLVINPGSGNHIIKGSFQNDIAIYDPDGGVIIVKGGYSGIIRFESLYIDVTLLNYCAMLIESGANVVLELVGTSILRSGSSRAGIAVGTNANLEITSYSHGNLNVSGNVSGIGADFYSVTAGTIKIYGNANVTATSGNGAGIGACSSRYSTATVIIFGEARVNASSSWGAGIGGGAESYGGGVGASGGTIIIEGNAVVTATSNAAAGIGGGYGGHTGGDGGVITIGGNAVVNATSTACTAIGGGRGGPNGHGGFGGIITIKDNAFVTAVGDGVYSGGIGGGPNQQNSGFGGGSFGCDIRITGGTINAASIDRGIAIGGTTSAPVLITGGSVFNGKGGVSEPHKGSSTTTIRPLYRVKLIVKDENGNNLDNIRLILDDNYEVETGKNLVWDDPIFIGEVQHGVAYVWLPEGECNVEVLNMEESFTPQSINVERINDGEFVIILNRENPSTDWIAWKGGSGTTGSDWNTPENWYPEQVPTATDNVVIPGETDIFPELDSDVEVNEIHFEPGAQLGGQSKLTGKAFIQYDFNEQDSRNRWHMLSMPLGQAYPGDFTFGGYPFSWVRTFKVSDPTPGEGSVTKGTWLTAHASETPLTYGDGFILWLNEDDTEVEKGLWLLDGIHELPFFHHFAASPWLDERILYEKVHQAHEYNPETGKSTFHNVELIDGEYKPGTLNYSVVRNNSANQLLKGTFSKLLNFGENSEAGGDIALVGNPYMATLNFNSLYTYLNNDNIIKNGYQIWTGNGYEAYTPTGNFGLIGDKNLEEYIAPLQAFLIEKSNDLTSSSGTLQFTESMTTVHEPVSLRSSVNDVYKLDIVARNPVAGIRTFIAKREGGQDEFGDRDARKIINSITHVPEVYTLKPYKDGAIAVGANIINSDELLIPVGLVTSYTGNITLSFNGMDSYDAKLSLIDAETTQSIDLTGLASYEYVINFTPNKKTNGDIIACENRFFIRISKTITGLKETIVEKVNVFEANGLIHVISGASNPVKEVLVYNLQGALMYKANALRTISHTIERNWPAGVYIVKVISEKNTDNVKLIIK